MGDRPRDDLSLLIQAANEGEAGAQARLFEGVHGELLRMARGAFRREAAGHTLQPTALVNEAWLQLAGSEPDFEGRAHFFGVAARAMRQILVDHARRAKADKRGGGGAHATLADVGSEDERFDVLELEDALEALEAHGARLAEVVQLRFFAGLSVEEVAATLDLSPATVKRDWTYARAWLFVRMAHDGESPG
ncbi:MAG: sigma-70 family RNA polymerase sigma factor [Planctomycetota bacterium]